MQDQRKCATNDQVKQYRREGFTFIQNLLSSAELEALRAAFAVLSPTCSRGVSKFAQRLIVTRNLWQSTPSLEPIVLRLGSLAGKMMGAKQVRLIDDVALIKPPSHEGGDPTVWHQDAPNFPFDRRGFLTVWIAVHDIPLEQGPLMFLPGSHRIGLLGAIDGASDDISLESLLKPEDHEFLKDPVTQPYKAGDASVHDGYTLHSAGRNVTGKARQAWGVRYVPSDTLYTGGSHRSFDALGLRPFQPLDHVEFPLISVA